MYAPNRLAAAHYAGGAVSVWDTSNSSKLTEMQSFHYTMSHQGSNTTLQDKPYPHGITVDPTGKYLVAMDRGADLLRTYAVGWDTRLTELEVFAVEPGIGPRHGVFVQGTGKTFFYVLGELTNSLLGFEVLYEGDSRIGFRQFYKGSTFQTGFGDASGVVLPSEIAHPEPNHLVLSVRNDNRQRYQGQESDTIITYEVDLGNGSLRLLGMTASGGKWPRSFAVSKDGTMIAVGNQYSQPGTLYVFSRNAETGVIDDEVALAEWTTDVALNDGGSISMILWDESA